MLTLLRSGSRLTLSPNRLSLVFEIVLNDVFYPIQELHNQSLDDLCAGGEVAQVTGQTNPLVNQHESLDAVFNCLEDMVSILCTL